MELRLGSAIALALLAALSVPGAGAGSLRPDPGGRRIVTLGRSVEGRPITAVEIGDLDSRQRVLIVGCVHGNETAGIAIANRLARAAPPRELDLWIVSDVNPDGVAAGTRGNADRVDLNRNFPWHWRALNGLFYSGQHPLSEPESRIAYGLIRRLDPTVSIWFHQHLDLVDESGGSLAVERRFASLTGLRLARLAHEPGSAVGWTNHRDPSGTAFVVELPAGQLSVGAVARFAHAVVSVSANAGQNARER